MAFIKPFAAPQRSVKIKIELNFSLRPGLGREGLNFSVYPKNHLTQILHFKDPSINSFIPNGPFLYLLKTENH